MKIDYMTFNGRQIRYEVTEGCNLSISDLDMVGMQYVDSTLELPNRVYLGVRAYSALMSNGNMYATPNLISKDEPTKYLCHNFGFGPALLIPVTKPSLNFVLVGQDKDYLRYDMDEIVERELLK